MPPVIPSRYANIAPDSNAAYTLALRALGWTIQESTRADRLLALTGLDGDAIRARIDDPSMLAAIIDFLESYEPDLIACASALDVAPTMLLAARDVL